MTGAATPLRRGPAPWAAWLAAAAWAGVILALSGDDFSAGSTSRVIGPLLRWLLPGASEAAREVIHLGVRKGAHAVEYGVLALLLVRALRASAVAGAVRLTGVALAGVLAVACADELRQARSAARGGSPADVALDLAGGGGALALAAAFRRRPAPRAREA